MLLPAERSDLMAGVSAIEELVETMARLRGPGGCPWDIEQDHQSIAQCLVDECSELLETIDKLDMEHMREELGDVLLQVVFHAQLAKEAGHFDFEAVAAEINEKLIRRHPHVFGDVDLSNSDAVLKQWDEIKAKEKANRPVNPSQFKDLPPALPALLFAYDVFKQIKKKALPVGDSVDMEAIAAMADELDEESAGHILFEIAAACRLKGIDPESAVRKFARRVMAESDAMVEPLEEKIG
ncbi:MazG family protein [Pelagicoccus sp. NFK12]|uniref:MazG family protein n=1 Tax=Pelagicoccus enzymogenes TaxID=2773457 RepID=A0A927IFK6_9BACT|nr:MazG family protein [Pelagicoccus enzymogenes]MBD5780207.1 MazG family protein [Pelagicoccus enzymogenes]MDQ8198530.1 MazG family protein [Pelagicoccus enzymogenes]